MKQIVRLLAVMIASAVILQAQEVPLEYQVKAAYLANFIRFVEWPAAAAAGPLTICVVHPDPFAGALSQTVDGLRVHGRPVNTRVISEPEEGCHVVFVPQDTPAAQYLRAASKMPVLTVGETRDFLRGGGLVTFVRDSGHVRFVIDGEGAERTGLRISSRLLRLARTP